MNKLKGLLLGSVIVLSQVACAQESVPTEVATAFSQKFPTAKNVKWDKETETEWEAEFKLDGKEYSANFTFEGVWQETEYEIKKSEIPAEVQATLTSEFGDFKMEESEISETAEGKVFEFILEKKETTLEVAISPTGKVIKKEVKTEEDEEDKD
jgi:hypothetical protein